MSDEQTPESKPASPRPIPPETLRYQKRASSPALSAWVSANAGSGKTWVLSRRVIRLLLDGTDPSAILCLTFTKAAAAQMANRVFDLLREWTTLSDEALSSAIAGLQDEKPTHATMTRARQLFARALETPGGLKIQTIHAFCERLLQQFTLEAGLGGSFKVLDDAGMQELMQQARQSVLTRAARHPTSQLGQALDRIVLAASDGTIEDAVGGVIAQRHAFLDWIVRHGDLESALRHYGQALGVEAGDTEEALTGAILATPHFPAPFLQRLRATLEASTNSYDEARAKAFARVAFARAAFDKTDSASAPDATDQAGRAEAWLSAFFRDESIERSFPHAFGKDTRQTFPELKDYFAREQARLAPLRARLAALRALKATEALFTLAQAILQRFETQKQRLSALDFGDLIEKTAWLLTPAGGPGWVHYKLDRGIQHILVDEAQDTSPRQWDIIRELAGDFFSGEGQTTGTRTLFAVGDEKQSIFSFQGAAPAEFARAGRMFEQKARAGRAAFDSIPLNLSFRSTPDVLAAVDKVFAQERARAGLTSDGEAPVHGAWRADAPGQIEIWPLIGAEDATAQRPWHEPLDSLETDAPPVRLAARIAAQIRSWLDTGTPLVPGGPPITAGDILILLRRRAPFAEPMNRALKQAGIPVAGADRLSLTSHIAVEDMMALLRVVLFPDDDLSLATVLKSPLFGIDDNALFDLAHERKGSLFEALRDRAASVPSLRLIKADLDDWMNRADFERPFTFLSGILTGDRRRKCFLERLGPDAEDPLDELLADALAFERQQAASLQAYLLHLEALQSDIKRDMEGGRDQVRVMTVHGAKGLEAPIVFMPDTCSSATSSSSKAQIIPLAGVRPASSNPEVDDPLPPLVWMTGKALHTPLHQTAADFRKQQDEDEFRRLLYVAMTRAKDRLYVGGFYNKRKPGDETWYALIRQALEPEAREFSLAGFDDPALLWTHDGTPRSDVAVEAVGERNQTAPDPARDEMLAALMTPLPPAPAAMPRLAPSGLATMSLASSGLASSGLASLGLAATGETAMPGAGIFAAQSVLEAALDPGTGTALLRGRLAHKLFEVLPQIPAEQQRPQAEAYLRQQGAALEESARVTLLDQVLVVMHDPAFEAVFAAGSRAEVPVSGRLAAESGRMVQIAGRIDRLAVSEDTVLIVDFKTNLPAPAVAPQDYVIQLAAYRALLAQLYPGRRIEAALLWTDGPRLERLDGRLMDEALAEALSRID